MAKDKERSVNPAQQQRKLEKAKALKKSKAELQSRRNEKLAKRNPDRIQRQIDDLKALESAGDIKPREKAILADLERDLKAVNKAKESLGEKVQTRPAQAQRDRDGLQSTLGKRRHDGQRKFDNRRQDSGSDTDESVRNIPWPRDTPPPVPKEFRRNRNDTASFGDRFYQEPAQPAVAKTTYESAPQIRDLKKEATSRFVPNVVQRKQDALKGTGGQLLEPEELDRLEREGYKKTQESTNTASENAQQPAARFSEYNPKNRQDLQKLKEEEEAFEREMAMSEDTKDVPDGIVSGNVEADSTHAGARLMPSRQVEMEEVDDEDL